MKEGTFVCLFCFAVFLVIIVNQSVITENETEFNNSNFSINFTEEIFPEDLVNITINESFFEGGLVDNWTEEIMPGNLTDENITEGLVEGVASPELIQQIEINKPVQWKIKSKDKNLEKIKEKIPSEAKLISNEETQDSLEVIYETPAPEIQEEQISDSKKKVRVFSNEEYNYTNVLAYSSLPFEIVSARVYLYHLTENVKEITEFTLQDLDGNGLYDQISWFVPHLSEQFYEIIVITNAEHLDENRNFIKNIYEEVKELDDVWSEEILSKHYVRVTFEKNLTSSNDITLFPRIISGNPKIEVYEKDQTEVLAEFFPIIENDYNTVLLTNLQGEQDTFDLKIVNGSLEFDYIVDPTFTFVNPTPPNGGYTQNSFAYINVTVGGNGLGSALLDWNRTLQTYLSFEETTGTTAYDNSTYSNNFIFKSSTEPVRTSSGIHGRAIAFDGSNDYANRSQISFGSNNFTISFWIKGNGTAISKGVMGNYDCHSYWTYRFYTTSAGKMVFNIGYDNSWSKDVTSTTVVTGGSWYHVVGVYDHVNLRIYINGISENTTAETRNPGLESCGWSNLCLGTDRYDCVSDFSGDHDYINATMDEFSMHSRALSAQEVNASYNNSLYRLESNFTALTNGLTYTYTAWAINTTGNKNSSATQNFTVDQTNPIASQGTNPVDNYNDTDGSIVFDLKCSDNFAVSTIQLWTNTTGTWHANYTNSSYTNNTWLNITVNGISTGLNYKWSVWCNDSAGNSNSTTNRTFNFNSDLTLPIASQGTNPVDNYNDTDGSIVFDLKCSDNSAVNTIQLWTNTTGTWSANYTNSSYTNNTWLNITLTGIPEGRNYKWGVWCNDTAGNSNSTTNRTLNVDKTNPVASQGTNPIAFYNSSSSSITFDLKCSDNFAVSTIQLWTNTTGTWSANYTNSSYTNNTWLNVTVTGISEYSNYKWSVWCNDSAGNSNSTTNRTFLVDLNAPIIELISPTPDNGSYVEANYSFINATVEDYKFDWTSNTGIQVYDMSGEDPTGPATNTIDGSTLTSWAYSAVVEQYITYRYSASDYRKGLRIYTSPTTNGAVCGVSEIYVSDDPDNLGSSLGSCSFSLVALPNWYECNFTAKKGSYLKIVLKVYGGMAIGCVDTKKNPRALRYFYEFDSKDSLSLFNYIDTCILSWQNTTGTWVNSTMTQNATSNSVLCYYNKTSLEMGTNHSFYVWANDTAGNAGVSETRTIGVDLCERTITLQNALSSGVVWTSVDPNTVENEADANDIGGGNTDYSAVINLVPSSCTADVYTGGDGDLINGGNSIPLALEKFNYDLSDPTVPTSNRYPLTTSYSSNKIATSVSDGQIIYLKYYLDVPIGQAAGTYGNKIKFKVLREGATP